MGTAVIMLLTVASMVAVGILAWKTVGKQEHGDADLEARLRADDQRAEAGRRRRAGLPPLPAGRATETSGGRASASPPGDPSTQD